MKKSTKIIIIAVLIVVLSALIGTIVYFVHDYNKDVVFTSIDDSFKITLPNKIKPTQTVINREDTSDYVLDLISAKKELFMYTTVVEKEREIDFQNLVEQEKLAISTSRENVRDLSDVSTLKVNDFPTYTYSYTYFDKDYNKDLYTEVYWVIADSKLYIFDFEVVSENMEESKEIFKNAINSIEFAK